MVGLVVRIAGPRSRMHIEGLQERGAIFCYL